MNSTVYSKDGKELRTIELADTVFGLPINEDLIWYAINNELANKRQGNACTKDRGEVHGSNAKPYRQKGTGHARRGDKKSPLLVGGGTIFGPKPRDFSWSLPKKAKRQAIKVILSLKAQSDMLKIIEDFSIESGKTKDLAGLLKNFNPGLRTVLILKDDDRMLKRAAANIPWLHYLSYNRLRAHDLFYGRQVLMLETAAKNLNDFYGPGGPAGNSPAVEGNADGGSAAEEPKEAAE
ncbi:MAG: 50S ribosomal protein L4 [Treponema sp.]|nr:50S ribosomal protein L4 [Treponema sp.]